MAYLAAVTPLACLGNLGTTEEGAGAGPKVDGRLSNAACFVRPNDVNRSQHIRPRYTGNNSAKMVSAISLNNPPE